MNLTALNARLIDDWRKDAPTFWSIRIAAFWGAVSGLIAVWPAFASILPLWAFAGASVVMCAAVAVARVTKQDGA